MIVYDETPQTNTDTAFNTMRALGWINRRLSVINRGSDTYFVKVELHHLTDAGLKQTDEASALYEQAQNAGIARASYWDHSGIHDDDDYPTLRFIMFLCD